MTDYRLISGIVSEYNPFHLGHKALIEQTRRNGATHIVAVMSGNYVQRGEPAIFSKWARTKMALQNGVDLVIELPFPWAISTAEHFSFGAVSLLNAMGCINQISFGSECANVNKLQAAASALLSPELKPELQKQLIGGVTFAKARQTAIEKLFGTEISQLFTQPNNILGIEYCKALQKLNSNITPFTINRIGSQHDETNENEKILSSSHIRNLILNGNDFSAFVPSCCSEIAINEIEKGMAPANLFKIETAILAKLRTMSREDFALLPDISEGLENRIYRAVRSAVSLTDLYDKIKSKRYTHARIRRIVLSAFVGLKKTDLPPSPLYLKVLGMNQNGKEILHLVKSTTNLQIITKSSDILSLDNYAKNMLELESKTTDLFSLCLPNIQQCGLEMTTGIVTV